MPQRYTPWWSMPFAVALVLCGASVAGADGPTATRSHFADRRWDAVTAADAGLAGA